MLEKYRPNFESLTQEEAALVADYLGLPSPVPDDVTGAQVYEACAVSGIDQAAVVVSMSRDASALGVSALEKLVGRPIVRSVPKKNAQRARTQQRSKQPRPVLRDDRVIRVLAESNPKKKGTKSYDRFELYEDGMTVQQFVRAGGKSADIAWDAERGFIRVEDAE